MKTSSVQTVAVDFPLIAFSGKGPTPAPARVASVTDYELQPRMCSLDTHLTGSGGDFGFLATEKDENPW